MKRTFSLPNPFAYFMQLSKTTKIVVFICITLLLFTFMFFTYQSGFWGEFMKWLFYDGAKKA